MKLKRIEAKTLADALSQVERECGKDALVIETRHTRNGYVILVSEDGVYSPRTQVNRSRIVDKLFAPKKFTRGFAEVAEAGMQFGLSRPLLVAIENALIGTRIRLDSDRDPGIRSAAAQILKALIPIQTTPTPHRVTALVGPTGVGKTTTLAKLAAKACREEHESVAILSLDTYRIAAVEQLRAFSEMLNVPFKVLFTPNDLRLAIREFESVDRVFIDTTGRSQFDDASISAMAGTLGAAPVHNALCVPAGLRHQDAKVVMDGFSPLDPGELIITKWDETVAPGETLSQAIERDLPISYITVGQEVPDDIVTADAGVLAATALDLEELVAEALL